MISRNRLRPIPFVAFLAAARASAAQAPFDTVPPARLSLRAELVGCYALSAGHRPLTHPEYYNASGLVRLETSLARQSAPPESFRMLVPLDSSLDPTNPGRRHPGPSWWADSLTDSVRLSFSNGFSGAFLVLLAPAEVRVDTLRGRIANAWDFGPLFVTQPAPARAVRVSRAPRSP
jgi:hypothetical protein